MNEWVLQELRLTHFKSWEEAVFSFSPGINCLVGSNGAGKTNVLDAIHYLSHCKSYFHAVDGHCITHQSDFTLLEGRFSVNDRQEKISMGIQRGQKKSFRRNEEEYKRLSDHIGLIPLVMISPADRDLIMEGSESRRKFIDLAISQVNKAYLDDLLSYNKALKQRNSYLRQLSGRMPDSELLAVYDHLLNEHGTRIYTVRKAFVESMQPVFTEAYGVLSEERESVSIEYRSKLETKPLEVLLKEHISRDQALEYTSVGTHKDDIDFLMEGYQVKRFGSQGQQKTFLIALKLAQYRYLLTERGDKPTLLLDDIFDKLDENRVKRIIHFVEEGDFGQIFITDTHADRSEKLVKEAGKDAQVIFVNQQEQAKVPTE